MVQFPLDAAEEAIWQSVRSCIAHGSTLDVSGTAMRIIAQGADESLSRTSIEDLLARAAVSASVPIFVGATTT